MNNIILFITLCFTYIIQEDFDFSSDASLVFTGLWKPSESFQLYISVHFPLR